MKLVRRLWFLLNRARFERELASEMEFHREMTGEPSFGNTLRLREESRDAWGWTWLDHRWQDVRYGMRTMRQKPGFTLAAVLMLAVGLGANVAVFGFFDLMVLRSLDVRDPETLLRFHRKSPEAYAYALPLLEINFVRDHSRTLSAVLAQLPAKLTLEGQAQPINVHFVSGNYFDELGSLPALGRAIHPQDDTQTAASVVVLSHAFWRSTYAQAPDVIGRTLRLNGSLATVIGIAGPRFGGLNLNDPDLWAPITHQPRYVTGSKLLTDASGNSTTMWGRLAPGNSPAAAEEELRGLVARLREQYPDAIWKNERLASEPGGYATSLRNGGRSGTGTEDRDILYPLLAAMSTFVLLILTVACSNLGSLLLARGVARQRELNIRAAVGASKMRLVQQLLTESFLLALLGAAAGLLVGYTLLRVLMVSSGAPVWMDATPNWRTGVFALGVAGLATLIFGLAPAFSVAFQRHRSNWLRHCLVGAQVAASCVLLIASGLLGRALNRATHSDPGFDYSRLVTIDPGLGRYGFNPARARVYLDTLRARLQDMPGVAATALTMSPPVGNVTMTAGITIDGRNFGALMNRVDAPYFATTGIPILRGRALQATETHSAVVSDSFAQRAWPGQDPLGKQFSLGDPLEVVGVSRNARATKLEDSDAIEFYIPFAQEDLPRAFVMVRTTSDPENVLQAVMSTARSIDPAVYPEMQLVKSRYANKVRGAKYTALSVGALSGIALFIACLGITGVVAYTVSQRTKEIGIRVALGAKPQHVLPSLIRPLSISVLVGLAAGVIAAVMLSQFLRSVLYGVSHLDAFTYLTAIVLFIGASAVAALGPVRRALRVNPIEALRQD